MTPLDSPFRSPSSQRESLRNQLLQAVQGRNGAEVAHLSVRWVHRQGVHALEPLMGSLGDAEAISWWREQLQGPRTTSPLPASFPPPQGWSEQPARGEAGEGQAGFIPHPAEEVSGPPTLVSPEISRHDVDIPAPITGFEEGPPAAEEPAASEVVAFAAESLIALEPLTTFADISITEPLPPTLVPLAQEALAAPEPPQVPLWMEPESVDPPTSLTLGAEAASTPGEGPQASDADGDTLPQPPVRAGRLARLRHLVRDCFEEVANTFQAVIDEGDSGVDAPGPFAQEPEPRPSPPVVSTADTSTNVSVAADRPLASGSPGHLVPEATESAPLTFAPRLPLSASATSRRAPRPAPAPAAHPGLEQLRSWLPDEEDLQERRAS